MKTKIYSDDPNLPYKTTKLGALYTRSEIDGLLAKWGIKDSMWHWEPEKNDVFLVFKFTETFTNYSVTPTIRLEAPAIWNHKTRKKVEEINWAISLRVLYWFIKTHLEAAYLQQSSKAAAFLPHIVGEDEKTTLKDIVIPRLGEIQQLPKVLELEEKSLGVEQ
jgi:hypothetical protein